MEGGFLKNFSETVRFFLGYHFKDFEEHFDDYQDYGDVQQIHELSYSSKASLLEEA